MDTSSTKPSSVKAKVTKPDKIESPRMEFEDMLIEHYKKYPRTAAMVKTQPTYEL